MGIYQDNRILLARLKWLRALFLFGFLVLFARLWQLMVLDSDYYREQAERNHVRTIPLLAPRGLIYDREGRVLVDNTRSFNLVLFRDEVQELEKTLQFLASGLQLDLETVRQRLEKTRRYAAYQPVVLKETISIAEISYVLSHQAEHPELRIFEQPRRVYRYGRLAAHALGYVGEVSEAQLQLPEFAQHKPGDIVGQFGVERSYNDVLTGRDGHRRVLVNSIGKTIQELGRIEPVGGEELTLALDLHLQMVAEEELVEVPGAIVAFDPRRGEILAMASRPAFDPNQFAARMSREEWDRLNEDPDTPFQNRVTQSLFSPGSIFKLVVAVAGLESQVIDPSTAVVCNGGALLYGYYFRCWRPEGHGTVRLREAIQHSCNVYFYLLGQKLGIDQISAFSRKVGLGQPTGIDLPGEAVGLIPSSQWKKARFGQPWYAGETISVSIGQGPISVTPLQLARAVGILATGQAARLSLVKGNASSQGEAARLLAPRFSAGNLEAIREAMWSVVNEWGTGGSARVAGFEVCGKTGTAQTISQASRARLSQKAAEKFEANAWFVGFAPRDNPEIVVTVIVQRGGRGGSVAGPIAGRILRRYYEKHRLKAPPATEVASLRALAPL